MVAMVGIQLLVIGIIFTVVLAVVGAVVWGGIALAKRGGSKEDIRRLVEEEVQRRLAEERNGGPSRPPAS